MMRSSERFSRRSKLANKHEGPLVYDDAPVEVRAGFLAILKKRFDVHSDQILELVCEIFRKRPEGNWTGDFIRRELEARLYDAEWYKFFDIVEAFSESIHIPSGDSYEIAVNELFKEEGIGWRLQYGELEMRGEEPLEEVFKDALSQLETSGFEVATQELTEARHDLSRRPEPDLSGAVTHAMAALEAVAKEWSGKPKGTLGDILKKQPDIFPPPLDEAVSKLWGFASNEARHGSEKRSLRLDEVFLLVGVGATLTTYLARKMQERE